ncbi:unnamed protein product [Anisakis simplex]|uniref:3-oxo-5-alpha-steroid 4-dehydrogenase 1 n=1 Tax=Anisakis simplex TaxID=6269 RepID=A0A0M3K5G0_ANISI|nr:unnamed protein product [Anisakis simplex]
MIPARLAWLLQEVPSLIIPLCYVITAFESLSAPNFVIISLFIIHYAQRSLVYSFLIKGGKPTPVHLFLGGLLFCTVNGYIQGVWQTRYVQYDTFWLTKPITCIGISVFVLGALVNIQSDAILRNLRRPGEKGYKIPKGGLFEYCSSANYFGELIEWIGYALAAQTLPSLTFAVFTFCNLAPRALYHHKWYLQKFEDYPKNRKAIIPFLL